MRLEAAVVRARPQLRRAMQAWQSNRQQCLEEAKACHESALKQCLRSGREYLVLHSLSLSQRSDPTFKACCSRLHSAEHHEVQGHDAVPHQNYREAMTR